jgi:hypothetical protein
VYEKPVGADAGLAAVAILGDNCTLQGGIEVGILEDDERGVSA